MSKYCDSTYSFWSKQYCIETVDGQAVWLLYNENTTLCAFFNSLRKVCVHREYLSVKIPCGNSKKFNNVWQWVFFPDDYEFYDQKSWNNGPPWIFRTVRKIKRSSKPKPSTSDLIELLENYSNQVPIWVTESRKTLSQQTIRI